MNNVNNTWDPELDDMMQNITKTYKSLIALEQFKPIKQEEIKEFDFIHAFLGLENFTSILNKYNISIKDIQNARSKTS